MLILLDLYDINQLLAFNKYRTQIIWTKILGGLGHMLHVRWHKMDTSLLMLLVVQCFTILLYLFIIK